MTTNPDPFPNHVRLSIAIGNPLQSSRMESALGQDGYDVITFLSARQLWENFAERRPRYVITDRRFADDFSALDLCRAVRQEYMLPYVYIHVLGFLNRLKEIEAVLDAGANDYSVKPLTPAQLRARVRVGLRWLQYIDSLTFQTAPAKAGESVAVGAT